MLGVASADGHELRRLEFRDRLLDAAEALIREHGDTSFSTRALAERAGVSPATPFNHFGSKRGVISAVAGRLLTRLVERAPERRSSAATVEDILRVGDLVVATYADDPQLYRPVFAELLGSRGEEPDELIAQAMALWIEGLEAARDAGLLAPRRNLTVIAGQLEIGWIGALAGWVSGSFDREAFRASVRYGTCLILANVVKDAERPALQRRIRALERGLSGSR